jgi:hypothetical protein
MVQETNEYVPVTLAMIIGKKEYFGVYDKTNLEKH